MHEIILGDSATVVAAMPAESFDAIVCDPPAGIGFMNRAWDRDRGGRDAWIAWMTEIARECHRVCKPGSHALVWALPRTSHWTATAWEDAGWIVRDRVTHMFGSGFPKSLGIPGAIDEHLGASSERERVEGQTGDVYGAGINVDHAPRPPYEPITDEAKAWEGWGTALKPAAEDWWLLRKPLIGTVAANVLAHGTGGLNIDACRIGTEEIAAHGGGVNGDRVYGGGKGVLPMKAGANPHTGRWPANIVLSHGDGCVPVGARTVRGNGRFPAVRGESGYAGGWHGSEQMPERRMDTDTVEAWECEDGCPVAELDRQSGATLSSGGRASAVGMHRMRGDEKPTTGGDPGIGDYGGASRFFATFPAMDDPQMVRFGYFPKPSTAEREAWGRIALEPTRRSDGRTKDINNPRLRTTSRVNDHATVKGLDLMEWLLRLVTPPGGRVLDPFAGSGSTIVAARRARIDCVGIEREERSARIARARIDAQWEVRLL